MVLLGPALAALGFILLLALGLLYQPELTAKERLTLCWCLLSGQTLLLWLYQQAILASRYRLFFGSFAIAPLWQRSVDILLMLVCSPILLLHLLIIAGADRVWKAALGRIDGTALVVSSPEVPSPVAARYAWSENPDCNLVNGAGLPATSFRTDDWVVPVAVPR